MKYALLYLAIAANLLTNVCFNFSALYDEVPAKKWGFLALGLVFGLINSVLFTEALKTVPLGIASAVFFSITIIGLFLVSHFYFHEAVNMRQVTGVFVVIAGVVMVSYK